MSAWSVRQHLGNPVTARWKCWSLNALRSKKRFGQPARSHLTSATRWDIKFQKLTPRYLCQRWNYFTLSCHSLKFIDRWGAGWLPLLMLFLAVEAAQLYLILTATASKTNKKTTAVWYMKINTKFLSSFLSVCFDGLSQKEQGGERAWLGEHLHA